MADHENQERLAELFANDRLADTLGVELRQWSGGSAVAEATPGAEHANFAGSVHGGFIYSAADVALAAAANSWGRQCVALSIDVKYLSGSEVGKRLIFAAAEINRSRSVGTYELKVHQGETLVAMATALAFRTGRWHFGEDAWSEGWRSTY